MAKILLVYVVSPEDQISPERQAIRCKTSKMSLSFWGNLELRKSNGSKLFDEVPVLGFDKPSTRPSY